MEGWSLFFMIVVLKIPLVAALFIIWYAIKEPTAEEETDGGRSGPRLHPPRPPRPPRRPTGGVGCPPPPCPQLAERRLGRPARPLVRRG